MCSEPMTRAPASGFFAPYCLRSAISPGISCSASRISLRPKSASARFFTLYGSRPAAFAASNACSFSVTVAMLLSCRYKQPWSFDARVGCERHNFWIRTSGFCDPLRDLVFAESEPHVAHLLTVVLAIVRQHIDDDQPSARLQDADG